MHGQIESICLRRCYLSQRLVLPRKCFFLAADYVYRDFILESRPITYHSEKVVTAGSVTAGSDCGEKLPLPLKGSQRRASHIASDNPSPTPGLLVCLVFNPGGTV